jgi:hypothetical protein
MIMIISTSVGFGLNTARPPADVPWMLGFLVRWGPHVVASAVGNLLAIGNSERACHCHVELGPFPSADSAVLGLLRSQLDRCGPEALRCPAVRACPVGAPPAAPELANELLALFALLVFIGGFLLGRVQLAPAVVGAPHRCAPLPDPPGPPLATVAAASPSRSPGLAPSSLKTLKDGRASANAGSA